MTSFQTLFFSTVALSLSFSLAHSKGEEDGEEDTDGQNEETGQRESLSFSSLGCSPFFPECEKTKMEEQIIALSRGGQADLSFFAGFYPKKQLFFNSLTHARTHFSTQETAHKILVIFTGQIPSASRACVCVCHTRKNFLSSKSALFSRDLTLQLPKINTRGFSGRKNVFVRLFLRYF